MHIKINTIKYARYEQGTKRERESEQSQTQGIYFEVRAPLLYIPAFDTWRISTKIDPTGSPGAATPTTLGLPSPYTRKPTGSPRPHLKQEFTHEL